MFFLLFVGILVGILLSPILEALLYFVISHKKAKPVIEPCVNIPTPGQAKQLFDSTHTCTDLAWFNVYLQRYFLELSQSYAYKDKLKRNMLKKFKPYEKYILVDIESIDVGNEAPMFSSVKVMTNKMLDDLVSEKSKKTKNKNVVNNEIHNQENDSDSSSFDNNFVDSIMEYKKEVEKSNKEKIDISNNSNEEQIQSKASCNNKTNEILCNTNNSGNEEQMKSEDSYNYKTKELYNDTNTNAMQIQSEESYDAKTNVINNDTMNNNGSNTSNFTDNSTGSNTLNYTKNVIHEKIYSKSIDKSKNDSDVEIIRYEINKNPSLSSSSTSSAPEQYKENKNNHKTKSNADEQNFVNESSTNAETNYDQVNFNNVTLLFDMEYKGTVKIKINVKFSKNINVPASFTLNYMKGPMLVRIPALLNHTRHEYNILNIEKLEFKLDSDISNKYIRKTATNFLHNVFIKMFKKTYVFPRFYLQYLPNVIPSMREIVYKYEKIDSDEAARNCIQDIMLIMMMDYKVIKVEKDIVYRKSNYYVNQTNRKINMNDINIKELLVKMQDEKHKNRKNNKKEVKNFYCDKERKMCVKSEKLIDKKFSKCFIQNNIANLAILNGVINSFIEVEDIKNYLKHDKLILKFENVKYKFVRFLYEDCVIFQSDESNEFFSFRLRNMQVLEVFYYATNKHFIFNEKRMRRMKERLQQKIQSLSQDGNNELNETVNSTQIIQNNNILQDFINYIKDGQVNPEAYKTKEIKLNLTQNEALECLTTNQRLRCMLYFNNFNITKKECNGSEIVCNQKVRSISTVIDNNYIIDAIDNRLFTGFLCTGNKNEQSTVKIVHTEDFLPSLLNTFICFLNIEERLGVSDHSLQAATPGQRWIDG
ncbi:hypothetical protein BDAP_001278 [Binucleata daphniae]